MVLFLGFVVQCACKNLEVLKLRYDCNALVMNFSRGLDYSKKFVYTVECQNFGTDFLSLFLLESLRYFEVERKLIRKRICEDIVKHVNRIHA